MGAERPAVGWWTSEASLTWPIQTWDRDPSPDVSALTSSCVTEGPNPQLSAALQRGANSSGEKLNQSRGWTPARASWKHLPAWPRLREPGAGGGGGSGG